MKDIIDLSQMEGMTNSELLAFWDVARLELRKLFVIPEKKDGLKKEWDEVCNMLRQGRERTPRPNKQPIEQPNPWIATNNISMCLKGEKAS